MRYLILLLLIGCRVQVNNPNVNVKGELPADQNAEEKPSEEKAPADEKAPGTDVPPVTTAPSPDVKDETVYVWDAEGNMLGVPGEVDGYGSFDVTLSDGQKVRLTRGEDQAKLAYSDFTSLSLHSDAAACDPLDPSAFIASRKLAPMILIINSHAFTISTEENESTMSTVQSSIGFAITQGIRVWNCGSASGGSDIKGFKVKVEPAPFPYPFKLPFELKKKP